jgi:multidrug resistance efflux pump
MKRKLPKTNHVAKRNVLRHLVPVAVWLTAVSAVVWLFHQRVQRFQVVGIAQVQVRQVATNCAGRLKRLPVRLYDRVTTGQVVAVVDTVLDNEYNEAVLRAQIGTISAEIEHLVAQLVPTQNDLEVSRTDRETTRISDLRRFSVDVENARLRILELRAQLAADRMTLQDLASEVKITEDLASREAVAPYELAKVKAQHETLAATIADNGQLLQQAQVNLETAQQRLADYTSVQSRQVSVESALEVIRKAIGVEEGRMQEVSVQLDALQRRHALELTSPVDGVVSQIWRNEGEAVAAGDPIVTIAEMRSTEVIGFARQELAGLVRENMTVEIVKATEPMQVATSRVTYVGPVVEQVPAQLWQNPNTPQWGRPFTVSIPPDLIITPGEIVGIRGL